MRYLVISDIHANIEALNAVLDAASHEPYHAVICLGDLVGYGGAPNDVIARVRELAPVACVRGNHDRVATGVGDAESFNPIARQAADWTRAAIAAEHLAYLAAIPPGPLFLSDLIEVCHGTPHDEDAYVLDGLDAARAIEAASRPLCLYGHTHIPLVIGVEDQQLIVEDATDTRPLVMKPGGRYLVNPGSVGQPRDGDSRAAFAFVDTDTRQVDFRRVVYDVARAQERIRQAGLPEHLARRLDVGH